MKVLVVDDTALGRVAVKDILVNHCAIIEDDIYEAENGIVAIKKYRSLMPDMVFLDINMPGIDGKLVVRDLVKLDPLAKIIMCTSSFYLTDVEECIKAGAMDYILKPPTAERILGILKEINKNQE